MDEFWRWLFAQAQTAGLGQNVIGSLIAGVLLVAAGNLMARGIIGVVGGDAPKLRLYPAPDQSLADVDWAHITIDNVGLPLSPITRTAKGVTVYGALDGVPVEFQWATTEPHTREAVDIYWRRPRNIPIAVRSRSALPMLFWRKQLLQSKTAHLTEAEFLTQAHEGKPAPYPLSDGDHLLELTAHSEDGRRTTARFVIRIPAYPGQIAIEEEFPWAF